MITILFTSYLQSNDLTAPWFFCYFLSISYKIAFAHYPPCQHVWDFGDGTNPLQWWGQITLGWRVQTKPGADENISQRLRASYR